MAVNKLPWYYRLSWAVFILFIFGLLLSVPLLMYIPFIYSAIIMAVLGFIIGTIWGIKRQRYKLYLRGEEIKMLKGAQNK